MMEGNPIVPAASISPPWQRSVDAGKISDLISKCRDLNLGVDPMVQAAIHALSQSPTNQQAYEYLQRRLLALKAWEVQSGRLWLGAPPNGEQVSGVFRLGCVPIDAPTSELHLTASEVLRGILVVGQSGSGKSVQLCHLLWRNHMTPGLKFMLITKKTDERGWAKVAKERVNVFPASTPFNHLNCMGRAPNSHASMIANLFSFSTGTMFGTQAVLENFLLRLISRAHDSHFPTWNNVLAYIRSIDEKDRRMREYLTSLEVRIQGLVNAFGPAINYTQGVDLRYVIQSHSIFELPIDATPEIRRFHVLFLLSWVFAYRRSLSREQLEKEPVLAIVLDDAHEFFDKKMEEQGNLPSTFEILTMARSYRVCFVVATHVPERLATHLWDNHLTTLAYRLPSEESRKKIIGSYGVRREVHDYLGNLKPGEGLIWHPRVKGPVAITSPMAAWPPMTDEEVIAHMKPFWDFLPPVPVLPASTETRPANELSNQQRSFLTEVINHPFDWSTNYYTSLAWSASTGNRIKGQLLDRKLIQAHKLTLSKRGASPELVEILTEGYRLLGAEKPVEHGKGRFVHRYWCSVLMDYFKDKAPILEKMLEGRPADVGVKEENGWQAYEVQLSIRKDLVEEILKKNFAAKFTSTTICVQTRDDKSKAEAIIKETVSRWSDDSGKAMPPANYVEVKLLQDFLPDRRGG